jgi:pimeloyl-ACP methyl ester carboxylesterase
VILFISDKINIYFTGDRDVRKPEILSYREYGSGRPLIILHGLLGSSSNWTATARQLAPMFKVYTPDLRNHGDSPKSDDYSIEMMARDIDLFMNDLGLSHAVIAGHSMGGKVAMVFADLFPEKTDGLVVIDIVPKYYEPFHIPILLALRKTDLSRHRTMASVVESLESDIPSLPLRYFIAKNLKETDDGLSWKINIDSLIANADRINSSQTIRNRYEKPVLFMKGEYSQFIRKDDEHFIRHLYPNAVIFEIPKAGHWVHIDQKETFVETLSAFIRKYENNLS